ncbi:MAG: protein-glutamate O-methyltransferase CheR [SAR324 cluster bacterium]|nr:protein-glutamate O-methyltransferase CheR [SAR324 cluster bacterium]
MVSRITYDEFTQMRALMVKICGLALNEDQSYLIETRLADFAQELGAQTYGELHRLLAANSKLWPRLVDLMTTNETFWFRDDSCWKTLERKIIPDLIQLVERGAHEINIWSAACSTGQEVYSLAMLIDEVCKKSGRTSLVNRFMVVGTDIANGVLNAAREGIYDEFNIKRGLSMQRRDNYFSPTDKGRWQVKEELRKRVMFRQINLMDSFMEQNKNHLVLCRNVAIYFNAESRKLLFSKIARTMKKEGFLMIGATESLRGYSTEFQLNEFENGVFYQPL